MRLPVASPNTSCLRGSRRAFVRSRTKTDVCASVRSSEFSVLEIVELPTDVTDQDLPVQPRAFEEALPAAMTGFALDPPTAAYEIGLGDAVGQVLQESRRTVQCIVPRRGES